MKKIGKILTYNFFFFFKKKKKKKNSLNYNIYVKKNK